MPGVGRDLRIRGLLFFCQALTLARNPNGGRVALDNLWRADRRVAGHYRQPFGFRGGRVDRSSQIARHRTQPRRLTRPNPPGACLSIPREPRWPPLRARIVMAYNRVDGQIAQLWE